MNKIPAIQLLDEVEGVLRTMPPVHTFGDNKPEHFAWLGRASAVVHAWDETKATLRFDSQIAKMNSRLVIEVETGARAVLTILHQLRNDLLLRLQKPLSLNVGTGAVFDYFDEIRKVIETAKVDLLFIDPYLDAEFVSRYLPHVSSGVTVRLLAREKISSLLPAVELLQKQSGFEIEIRSAGSFHDRYVIVDRTACYQSGSSFKDGAKKAPTTVTQIIDAFPAVLATYEDIWNKGTSKL
jgi:hypothetical protein